MKLLFVFSSNDPVSVKVFNRIKAIHEIKDITTPVDMCNEKVNTIIKNSTNIVLNELPAIFTHGDGKIDKFEGVDSVTIYLDEIENNINAQSEPVEQEQYISTKISDLNLEEDPVVQRTPINQTTQIANRTPIDQGPPRPDIQNMPIKSKRPGTQKKKIDEFMNKRSTNTSSSDTKRIQITSPKMEMPSR